VTDWTSAARTSIATTLLGSWPSLVNSWGREALAAYVRELEARCLTPDDALVALRMCDGQFPPSAPELAALARRDPSRPTSAEALAAIFGPDGVLHPFTSRAREMRERIAACERGCSDGWLIDDESNTAAPCDCRGMSAAATDAVMLARAADVHPLLAAFVQTQGLDRLRRLDLDDPDWGQARRKQLADEWEEFVDVNETRDVAALTAGRRGGLGRVDPLRALPAARARLAPVREAGA
jgi:hypothetical protein